MNEKDRITSLVVRLKNGDKSAFDELYKLTCSKVYFVSLKITKNEHDTEDIIQESYVTALKKLDTLEKPESFMSWFNQIVANKSKAHLRKTTPQFFEDAGYETVEAVPDDSTAVSPEDAADKEDIRSKVMESIDELTEEKRACVMMMYFGDMSINDISGSLGVPVSTVKNRLWSARKDLKSRFEKRGIAAAYSVAPMGLVSWALKSSAEAFSQNFQSGINPSDIISVAAAGTAAAGTAAAGTSIAAKIAALSTVQKIAAGVAVAGIVAGSTVGITTVVKGISVTDDMPLNDATTAIVEEYTDSYAEIPVQSPAIEIVEETPPVNIVETGENEENPKHESLYISPAMNAAPDKHTYLGTVKEGKNSVGFEDGSNDYFCDFRAEKTGYYIIYVKDNTWDIIASNPMLPKENTETPVLAESIFTGSSHEDYRAESHKGLYYMQEGEWFLPVYRTDGVEKNSAEIIIEYCGEEITDVEFRDDALNNRIIGYNLNLPFVTMGQEDYYCNVYDMTITFSSGREELFESTMVTYYVEGGVKEGENTAVFELPNKKIEKTLVAHPLTDYIEKIEVDNLKDFLEFEINENGFDISKPEEYTVTVTYGDGTKETFNGADWDKKIVLKDGTVLVVEFTQPKLTDREPVQFLVLIGDEAYIRENCRLTGIDPIGFTKKMVVFSADAVDVYVELIGDSHHKLFSETENLSDFSVYLPEAIRVTAVNLFRGTKRLAGYGLDLVITFYKIATENIITE